MRYDPIVHGRRSVRLRDYDYAQPGAYYLTICAHQRRCTFGVVKNGRMYLSRQGDLVAEEWLRSCEVRPEVTLDEWQVMPNHLHGIVFVGAHGNAPPPLGLRWPDSPNVGTRPSAIGDVGTHGSAPSREQDRRAGDFHARLHGRDDRAHCHAPLRRQERSLGSFVGGFKGAITRRVNTPPASVWQRGYHEHVIRDEAELHDIRLYITKNPAQWDEDPENPRYKTIMGKRR